MRLVYLVSLLGVLTVQSLQAQDPMSGEKKRKLKGEFFLEWGYHRDTYSNSTIHFEDHKTGDYDFTLHNASAKDKPDWDHFFKTPLTVPQYVLSGGYFFNDKHDLGIELCWNHLKYVVTDGQTLHLTGDINETHYDRDTVVTPDFVHFEHTNGNNYLMLSLLKRVQIVHSRNENHVLSANFRLGGGGLVPKTDSYIMGKHNDGPFRLSGYVIGVGGALRYDVFRYLFLQFGIKGSWANYTDAKLYEQGRAQHSFWSAQYILSAGFNIPTKGYKLRTKDTI